MFVVFFLCVFYLAPFTIPPSNNVSSMQALHYMNGYPDHHRYCPAEDLEGSSVGKLHETPKFQGANPTAATPCYPDSLSPSEVCFRILEPEESK